MENLQKIAMLIDADNTQLAKLEAVIQEVNTLGRIVVKRAYGNWKKDTLKNWETELKRLAIKAEQQFDYVAGKNATDIALVIDAMHLLYRGIYDAFVIVASDSDYTPLALDLHESGVYVIGVGEAKTPESFRNSCDDFIYRFFWIVIIIAFIKQRIRIINKQHTLLCLDDLFPSPVSCTTNVSVNKVFASGFYCHSFFKNACFVENLTD